MYCKSYVNHISFLPVDVPYCCISYVAVICLCMHKTTSGEVFLGQDGKAEGMLRFIHSKSTSLWKLLSAALTLLYFCFCQHFVNAGKKHTNTYIRGAFRNKVLQQNGGLGIETSAMNCNVNSLMKTSYKAVQHKSHKMKKTFFSKMWFSLFC